MKKYELLDNDTKTHNGVTLRRVRALRSFGNIEEGELGGFIEKEENLSHRGNAWVYGNARVSGNARVEGNAWVLGNAWVSGDARVYGDARVSGDARVYGDAWVYGNARVSGNARVLGDADWFLVGPAKSSGRFTTAYKDEKIGVRVSCGCFSGSVEEFSEAIEETHADKSQHLEQYRLFCQLISTTLGE
jgi:hypothetical protein